MKFEEVADPGQTILAHVRIVVRRMCEDFNQRQASAVHLLAGPVDCDRLLLQIQLARLNRRRRLIFLDQLWFPQSQYDTSASRATQAHVCLIDELQGYKPYLTPNLDLLFLEVLWAGVLLLPLVLALLDALKVRHSGHVRKNKKC